MEFEAIESIFGGDVEDLRVHGENTQWKPLNFRLALTPLQGSLGHSDMYVRVSMRVICSSKYPKVPPRVSLELSQGLSDSLIQELQQQLLAQAEELRGQEMIYELAQTVQVSAWDLFAVSLRDNKLCENPGVSSRAQQTTLGQFLRGNAAAAKSTRSGTAIEAGDATKPRTEGDQRRD